MTGPARRLRALEVETARRAQVAQDRNRAALVAANDTLAPGLRAVLVNAVTLWGNDLGALTTALEDIAPPDLHGLEDGPAGRWTAAVTAAPVLTLTPMPDVTVIPDLHAQAVRWGEVAEAHAGTRHGRLALIAQAYAAWWVALAGAVIAQHDQRPML
ncbi:hypothetical protein [Deinococcus sp. Leaf326]|uniref:hypothetical protein n=1 Tax=Deinococcus sp. Leaf326 TaxID=1736338 RepID=UPI0006FA5732|nr:hypothetical protein [Deinococcus sp. Leaf326]KQR07666.1 hypothetical protein ASF71_20900 [Deinococcus sp. Leaf326]